MNEGRPKTARDDNLPSRCYRRTHMTSLSSSQRQARNQGAGSWDDPLSARAHPCTNWEYQHTPAPPPYNTGPPDPAPPRHSPWEYSRRQRELWERWDLQGNPTYFQGYKRNSPRPDPGRWGLQSNLKYRDRPQGASWEQAWSSPAHRKGSKWCSV